MNRAPRLAEAWKDRHVTVMTVLGVGSGVLCVLAYNLREPYREASVGIIFGVIIAARLAQTGQATLSKAFGFAVFSCLSWLAAERFAIKIFGAFPEENDELWSWPGLVSGASGGLLGALLLVISIWMLFPFFRKPGLCSATILTGGVLGCLLPLADRVESLLVLFPPWQGAFALCFALGFPKDR